MKILNRIGAILLGFVILGGCFSVNAQDKKAFLLPDSLSKSLETTSENTEKHLVALERVIDFMFDESEYQNALPYIHELNELANNQKNVYYKALGNYYLGTQNIDKYELTEAIEQLIIAKNLLLPLPESQQNRQLLSRIYLSSSACYQLCNMLSEAYDQVQKGLDTYSESDSKIIYFKLKNNLAVIYDEMNKEHEAIAIYKNILLSLNDLQNNPNFKQRIKYTANLNIGKCFFRLNQLDSSLVYLDSAYQYAVSNLQKARIFEVLGSQYLNKDFVLAEKYYKDAINYMKTENDYFLSASINSSIAEIYYITNQYDTALLYINEGIENAKRCNRLSMETKGLFLKAKIYEKMHRLTESLACLYEHKTMMDSLYGVQNIEQLSQLMLQTKIKAIEKEHIQQQYITDLEHSKERILYYCVIALLVGVIIVVILLLNRKRILLKNKQIKEEMLSIELETRNRELAFNVVSLMKKNEIFTEIIDKLLTIKENVVKDETKDALSRVIKEIEKTTEGKFWDEFEMRFKQVHSDFYNQLTKKFPNLTTNEMRLCAFLKLNLTTKDISSITGQSVASIEKARYRLRKKLGIQNDVSINLSNFISNI